MPTLIKPTVGRKVWYRPSRSDAVGPIPMHVSGSLEAGTAAPLDATVIAVWGDRMVNVLVTDIMGRQFPKLSVTLLQDGDLPTTDGGYVQWMPYQVQQEAKAGAQPDSRHPALQAAKFMDASTVSPPGA